MNLSELTPKRQEEIVNQRIADMRALNEHAVKTKDPIVWMTLELDAQARLAGLDVNYCESLDGDEIE